MRKRSVVGIVLAVVLMIALCATSAFAATSYDYAISKVTYSWLQGTNSSWVIPIKQNSTTEAILSPSIGYDQIAFEGIATSSEAGGFQVELQKQGWFGIWSGVGNTYTVQQHHEQTTNFRTDLPVTGQYFRLYWSGQGSGKFRIVVKNPTDAQVTGLSDVYFYGFYH